MQYQYSYTFFNKLFFKIVIIGVIVIIAVINDFNSFINDVAFGILLLLTLAYLLKTVQIVKSIYWADKNQRKIKNFLQKKQDIYQNNKDEFRIQLYELFDNLNGNFYPFGYKDYQIKKHCKTWNKTWKEAKTLSHKNQYFKAASKYLKAIYKLIDYILSWLFRYQHLLILTCICLCTFTFILTNDTKKELLFLSVSLSLLTILDNFLITLESILLYSNFKDNAVCLQVVSIKEKLNGTEKIILELQLFGKRLISFLLTGTATCYVSEFYFKAFQMKENTDIGILFNCFYFTTTTFLTVGYGDIVPKDWIGKLVSLLIMAQSFMFIVVVFALVMSNKEQTLANQEHSIEETKNNEE
ncbi:MAG: ion channel [Waterburya sp.]